MNLLALDLGTHTGWASLSGSALDSGVQAFTLERGESPGMRFLRFRRFLEDLADLVKPDLIVYEKGFLMPTAHASEIHFGFSTIVQSTCALRGIEHAVVNAMKLKKWTTGKGNAKKAAMLEAVNARWMAASLRGSLGGGHACGPNCVDPVHDEADALAVLHYAVDNILPAIALRETGL